MKGKDSRYTYVIIALICLIVFNIGAFLISIRGKENYIVDNLNTRPVFSQRVNRGNEGNFFINLFSKTSAAIKLYKRQVPNIQGNISVPGDFTLREKFFNFIKSQFPSIIFDKIKYESKVSNKAEEDSEESIITEDFIIIENVEEYEDLIIISDTDGNIILENLPKPINVKPITIDKEKPYVLIYHTHGTEAYSNQETNIHHTTDKNYNVVTIGENIAKVLEGKGHKVEHITTYHDIPSYNQSYSRSLNTVTEKLQENNNLKILVDVHRDGVDLEKTHIRKNLNIYKDKYTTNIDGKDVATFYFVIGPDAPNKEEILSFAKYFKAISDIIYPDLCTGILIKPRGKYNQFMSDYSMLVEIGSNINTMEEALESARLFGELMDIVIQNITE